MTLLAVSVFGDSIEQVRSEIDSAVELGADLIELRVDLMENLADDEIRSLRQHRPSHIPLILTIRTKAEGGAWDGPDDQRISRIIELAPAADYIDIELATWQRSANIRQKICQALARTGAISPSATNQETATATGPRLILSRHHLTSRPPKLQTDFLAMLDESPAPSPAQDPIPKLVWPSRTVRDNFEALELLRQSPRPPIIICTGDEGLASRVLARKFGAFATFAAVAAGREAAAGQPSIADLKNLYRWDTIDAETRVYGVLGDPVQHSLSPRLHNAAFAATGENAVYLPWRILGSYESFKAFMVEVTARPWLDFRGFSVTIPHKQNALRYLHETGGTIDPLAQRIGALNTLTLAPDGHLTG
ncbi:MAG: type I 3-dehydroquinate dehydratase, partial [Dehalococcoidia bacterium]